MSGGDPVDSPRVVRIGQASKFDRARPIHYTRKRLCQGKSLNVRKALHLISAGGTDPIYMGLHAYTRQRIDVSCCNRSNPCCSERAVGGVAQDAEGGVSV